MNSWPALAIEGLSKVYKNGVHALNDINLSIAQGDFFALLGPNGAGKSTLIGIVTSLVNKTAGQVRVWGHSIDNASEQAKACIGVVPQEFNFNVFEKVLDVVVQQAGYYGVPRNLALKRAEQSLKRLDLWSKHDQPCRSLSGGMKRRLMIACSLVHDPRILILDEPTAGVDIEIRHDMWNFLSSLNQQGTTIILTTHYLEEAEKLCKNVAIVKNGRIVQSGKMADLLADLEHESFILQLAQPLSQVPTLSVSCCLLDPKQLEVTLKPSDTLSHIFSELSLQGCVVKSLRNKTNRLENLFLSVTDHSRQGAV